MAQVRNALGYCLSEALFQQAGWESEEFRCHNKYWCCVIFATHKYHNKMYFFIKSSNAVPSVIYRWSIKREEKLESKHPQ